MIVYLNTNYNTPIRSIKKNIYLKYFMECILVASELKKKIHMFNISRFFRKKINYS